MRPTRNDIDNELHAIITSDSTDPDHRQAAHMIIASRERIIEQLDAQAFARSSRSAKVARKRSTQSRGVLWLSGALAACIVVIVASIVNDAPDKPGINTGVDTAQRTDVSSTVADAADHAELDLILAETMTTVDDVWDRGEVDIDRLIKDPSR